MAGTDTAPSAQQFIPPGTDSLAALRSAATGCQGCDLYQRASQTVFGRGDEHARVVFVGEQPGDLADRKGLPFVGPAGHLLRRAVDDAGLDPAHIYLTNAVKHFRFGSGVLLPWPESAQRPQDFAQVPVGPTGQAASVSPTQLVATVHPSAVLRADNREVAYGGLVDDLKVVVGALS